MSSKKQKIKLNIGCGISHKKGYINIDKYVTRDYVKKLIKAKHESAKIDPESKYLKADWKKLPYGDNSVDYIESVDTIEHFGFREVSKIVEETHRVLKLGCMARIMTIDFNALVERWYKEITTSSSPNLDTYMSLTQSIYGNQHNIGQFHKCPWTPAFAHQVFIKERHFKSINILIFVRFSNNKPPLETITWDPKKVFVNQSLIIEVVK